MQYQKKVSFNSLFRFLRIFRYTALTFLMQHELIQHCSNTDLPTVCLLNLCEWKSECSAACLLFIISAFLFFTYCSALFRECPDYLAITTILYCFNLKSYIFLGLSQKEIWVRKAVSHNSVHRMRIFCRCLKTVAKPTIKQKM